MALSITELLPDTSQGTKAEEWVEITSSQPFTGIITLTVDGATSDPITVTLNAGQFAVLYNADTSEPNVPSGAITIPVTNWPDIPTGGNNDTFSVSISDPTDLMALPLDTVSDIPTITGQNIGQTYDVSRGTYGAATPGAPECFLTGTLILTQNGEVKVEELSVGDLVETVEGKFEAIKWIGRQTVDPQAPYSPFRSLPIQIKAGALGVLQA